MEPDSLSFLTPITKHSHSVFSTLQNTSAAHQAQDDVYFEANGVQQFFLAQLT